MLHRRWILIAVVTLLVLGLLIGGGYALYRAAWSAGFVTGQITSAGEGTVTAPYVGPGHFGRYFGPVVSMHRPGLFFMIGPLFTIGMIVLLIVLIAGLFRRRAWRMSGGPAGEYWHHPHGPVPPWCQPAPQAPEQPTGPAQPTPQSDEGKK